MAAFTTSSAQRGVDIVTRAVYRVAVLAVLTLAACAGEPEETNPQNQPVSALPEPDPVRVMFFGDSITAGYQLDEGEAFPAVLQEKTDSLGWNVEFINAGLSGETSAGGLRRIDWVLQEPVDVFVLELGGNDGLRGTPLEETRSNLEAILEAAREAHPNAELVVAGMQIPPNLGAEYTEGFRQIFPELAQAEDAALIPFILEGVAGVPRLNLPDGIHPTAEGHEILAENVWDVIEPLVREAVEVKEAECTVDVDAILAGGDVADAECGF
jgi:acyl-CoA thioesterase-1